MKEQMQWIRPEEIEARSMEIIESEMPRRTGSSEAVYSYLGRF